VTTIKCQKYDLGKSVAEVVAVPILPATSPTPTLFSTMAPSAAKQFVFTWNNPTLSPEELIYKFKDLVTYMVFQLEEGEKEKTPHYQGYIEMTKPCRITALVKIQQMWYAKRAVKSTRDKARAYAMKEEGRLDGPWESNEWPPTLGGQGQRTDLITVYERLRAGESIQAVADDNPATFIRYPRAFKMVQYIPVMDRPRENFIPKTCKIYCGPTRLGKTRHVYDKHPDLHKLAITKNAWFDGYHGQTHLLFDDFSGNVNLTKMLQMLDGYPCQVEIKGDMVWLKHTGVSITCNTHPSTWWTERSKEERDAFMARCDNRVNIFHRNNLTNVITRKWESTDPMTLTV